MMWICSELGRWGIRLGNRRGAKLEDRGDSDQLLCGGFWNGVKTFESCGDAGKCWNGVEQTGDA
jgi:hypothetical protein